MDGTSTLTNGMDDEFDTVQITYIDPNSDAVCCRDVYCDREDWRNRYQARLLVSSDLVNSLNEAVEIWKARFEQSHRRLTKSRMGYYYELWSIRGYLTRLFDFITLREARRLASSEDADDMMVEALVGMEPPEEEAKPIEICPVHFFYPDMYLDAWTKDRLGIAMESCRRALDNEIQSINERINLMGGGTWRQLLAYFLRHGSDPIDMVKELLKAIEDPDERKEIVNTMTNGLQDSFDELQSLVDLLMAENQDMTRRWLEIKQLEERQRKEIDDISVKLKEMQKYLDAPGFVEPVQEDNSKKEVKQARKQLFEQKEASIKAYTLEVRRLRALLQEWRERNSQTCDPNVLSKLQEEVTDLKRQIKVTDMRTESYIEQVGESDLKTDELQVKMEEERQKCDELRARLGKLPPPNPIALKMKRMQREIKQLAAEDKKIKKELAAPTMRIKAMRMQLRALYDKLGWDWDLSDSEDECGWDEMPYWQRRKLAANGFMPFNQHEFLAQEGTFKRKRKQKLETKSKKEQESVTVAQMKAKRVSVLVDPRDLPSASREEEEEEEEEVGPILFGSAPASPRSEDESPKASSPGRTTSMKCGVNAVTALLKMKKMLSKRDAAARRNASGATRRSMRSLTSDNAARRSMVSKTSAVILPEESKDVGDPISRAISSARENLSSSRVRTPSWLQSQRTEEEREVRQTELERLLQLRESYENQLRQCLECFIDMLPGTGALADLRNRLVDTLARLHEPPQDPPIWQEQELEEDLQRIGEAFQEAIDYGESVRPISAAMVHSIRFRDLRHMLEEVLLSERTMREAISDLQGSRSRNILSDSSDSSPEPSRLSRQMVSSGSLQESCAFSTSRELSESLRVPPRFQNSNGQKSKKQLSKKVDFGFRPDGAGEDSLENWSLFKVSKGFGSTYSGLGDTISTSVGLTSSASDKLRRTETKVRRHQASFDCDFHEYMSQARERDSSWQTASAPSLHISGKTKKSLPSLPKLIKSASLSSASGKSIAGLKGDGEGGWKHCPSRISVPVKKLTAITPSNAFFA